MTEWGLNLMAFLGILVLSVPVWRLNRNKRLLQRLKEALAVKDQSRLRERVGQIAEEKQSDEVAAWRWWHEACLWLGYGLLLGSAGLRLLLP